MDSVLTFFKGISISLTATGPAALFATWFICMTVLGIFGTGELAGKALGFVGMAGMFLVGALGTRAFKD